MSKSQTELAARLSALVGGANVTASPALRLDGLAPAALVKPASAAEAADCLRVCSELNAAVIPAGQGTWLECGNPLRRADVVLSLERMSRIIDYSPPDLTVTAEAGLTLSALNEITGRDRLWLPLDPPGAGAASIGAAVACNSSGALRCGFGTPRDYVIGLKLAHADGSESKSGGRVVKNVAGYDLNKLYVGSYGTLAAITELTFKLSPLPERVLTIALTPKDGERLADFARRIATAELQPVASVLTTVMLADTAGPIVGLEKLLLRFADNDTAVQSSADWLRQACDKVFQITEVTGEAEAALWAKINDFDYRSPVALKMSVPLSKTVDMYEDIFAARKEPDLAADLGSGIVRVAWSKIDDTVASIRHWRVAAQKFDGTLFVERAPLEARQQVDAWDEVGASVRLMKAIKEKFDPQGILNPGRFVAGI
jgi:glycolate dehydrogenase FAD-binding subunit